MKMILITLIIVFFSFPVYADYKDDVRKDLDVLIRDYMNKELGNRLTEWSANYFFKQYNDIMKKNYIIPDIKPKPNKQEAIDQ